MQARTRFPFSLSFLRVITTLFVTTTFSRHTLAHIQIQPNRTVYRSYQHGIVCSTPFPFAHPKSIQEIQSIVKFALSANLTLKPVGSLHSVSDMICTEGIPIKLNLITHFSYNSSTGLATVGAGMKLFQLMEKLDGEGRSLLGIPAYGDLTIGGAIATGAHGSSLIFPSTLSDQMIEVRIVDGLGNVKNITNSDELMNAFRAHLGLLGIVYEVVFQTVPQYKIETEIHPVSDKILDNVDSLIEMARKTSFVQLWWFPTSEEIVVMKGNIVDVDTPGNCQIHYLSDISRSFIRFLKNLLEAFQESRNSLGLFIIQKLSSLSLYRPAFGRILYYGVEGGSSCWKKAVGFSHKMQSSRCENCAWSYGDESLHQEESEVVIPLSELKGAVKALQGIMRKHPVHFPLNGIFFRFITPSTGLLNVNRGQESVGIEWVVTARKDRWRNPRIEMPVVQAMQQILVFRHKGRTHWAKSGLYYSSPEMISTQHGNHHQKFASLMTQMDPEGTFLNDFGRRVRFGHAKFTLDPKNHCAVAADHCICKADSDCGNGGPTDYKCRKLFGFDVCMTGVDEIYENHFWKSIYNIFIAIIREMPIVLKST